MNPAADAACCKLSGDHGDALANPDGVACDCGRYGCLETLACPAFNKVEGQISVDESLCSGCMVCMQISKAFKAKKRGA